MNSKRATIKDVAVLAGVSISTVSRSLSGNYFVEDITKQKVLKAAKELHYEPNMIARGLKNQKSNTIAIVLPDINSLYYSSILDGVEEVAAEKEYSIFISNSRNSLDKEKTIIDTLGKRSVDGIICMTVGDDIAHISQHRKIFQTPMVFLNRNLDPEISSISIDMEYGAFLLTDYLAKNGHKKIAGVFSELKYARNVDRYEGYERALWKNHLEQREEFILKNVNTTQEAFESTKKMLEKEDRPTGIFISEEHMVLGVYKAISSVGLSIPEDISVVGFDNTITAPYYIPALTTYDSKVMEIAVQGTKMLFEQIDKKKMRLEHLIVQGTIIKRNSVRTLQE